MNGRRLHIGLLAGALGVLGLLDCAFAGRTSYSDDFLYGGLGGRSFALGPGFAALADDASAVYWNPAGLGQLTQLQTQALYRRRFQDLFEDHALTLALPIRSNSFGFSYYQTVSRDIMLAPALTEGDVNLIQMGEKTPPPASSMASARDSAFLFGWGRRIFPNISAGMTAKIMHRDFVGALKGYGYGLDLGWLWKKQRVSVGMNLRNVLHQTSWRGTVQGTGDLSYEEDSRFSFALGAGYNMPLGNDQYRLLLVSGVEGYPSEINPSFSAEVQYYAVSLRGGLSRNIANQSGNGGFSSSAGYQPCWGLGLRWRSFNLEVGMKYHPLGWVHNFNITYRRERERAAP